MKCPICKKKLIWVETDFWRCPKCVIAGAFTWEHYTLFKHIQKEVVIIPPYRLVLDHNEKITEIYYQGNPSHHKHIITVPIFPLNGYDDVSKMIQRYLNLMVFS